MNFQQGIIYLPGRRSRKTDCSVSERHRKRSSKYFLRNVDERKWPENTWQKPARVRAQASSGQGM